MREIKTATTIFCVVFVVFGVISSASALTITPATGVLDVSRWEGCDPGNPDAADIPGIVGYSDTLYELYKQDVPKEGETVLPPDEGSFAAYYKTTFYNTPTDPKDATIEYVGAMDDPVISGDPLYLLVKDGSQDPCWYIFDLVVLAWNGTDTIDLQDFWPENGAISHVSIYGTRVPEPLTFLLLGMGLIGLAGIRKKLT